MNNEELKKKIVEILQEAYMPKYHGEPTIYYCTDDEYAPEVYYPTDEDVADALIAAGMVDKSDYASMKETAVRYKAEVSKAGARVKEAEAEANRYEMLYKLQNRDMALAERRAHDAEHRAARAERALLYACKSMLKDRNDTERRVRAYFNAYLERAEKELAEERKDD